MTQIRTSDIESSIARCRVVFSVITLASLLVDPTWAILPRWLALSGGASAVDPRVLLLMGGHLCYSLMIDYLTVRRRLAPAWLATITTWNDILFAAVIALCTHGANSP